MSKSKNDYYFECWMDLMQCIRSNMDRCVGLMDNYQKDSAVSSFLTVTYPDQIDMRLRVMRDEEIRLMEEVKAVSLTAPHLHSYGLRCSNSTLLYGLPGTGKTTFVHALAKKLGLPLITLRAETVLSYRLGETQSNLATVFDYVKNLPCVFFMDELDALGMERGSRRDHAELDRIAIVIMQMLDTLPPGFVLVAYTNRADTLDPALYRRFTRCVELPPFDKTQAVAMVRHTLDAIFPGAYADDEISWLLGEESEYNPSALALWLERAIVASWPGRPNLMKL